MATNHDDVSSTQVQPDGTVHASVVSSERAVQNRVISNENVGYYNSHNHDTTMVTVAVGSGVCLSPGFLMGNDPGYRWIPFECPEYFDCAVAYREKENIPSVRRFVEVLKGVYEDYSGPL